MPVVVDFQNVSVVRDRKLIVDDVTWAVCEDERWVIIGASGAGKTTLLMLTSALEHPTDGVVTILDEEPGESDVFGLRPRIGLAATAMARRIPATETVINVVMTDPEVLLLDEPAASFDLGSREELVHQLGEYAASQNAPVIVMVTHHVEEIPPGFTHALVLKDGHVYSAGPISTTLSSDVLCSAFGIPITVSRVASRFAARGK